MAYCDKCGAYISSGNRCTDCANNTYLVDTFVDYINEQNRRTYVNVRDSTSRNYDDDDDSDTTDYDTSSYSSSYGDDQRNGFVSFLFALVIGVGVCLSGYLVYKMIADETGGTVQVLVILGGLIAGIIITFIAWRNKKNILFVIMLLLSLPGLIGLFTEIKETRANPKTEQTP